MNCLLRIVFYSLILCISSCASQQTKDRAIAMAQCKMSCSARFETCNKHCVNNCPNCTAEANHAALDRYNKYYTEQKIEGGYVFRELNSFRDPLQCRKVTCNCSADFNACSQGCTGIIQKQLTVIPYCT